MSNGLDEILLRRFVNGDRAAFESLFRTHEREVYRWIVRIVRDRATAEDGVIEAFWRCYRSRGRFNPSRGFGAWIRRIATNVAIDLLHDRRRHPRSGNEPDATPDESADTSSGACRQGLSDAIAHAFESLPPKLRVVATLALIEECPHAEISDALGVPIGTVKSRLFRATRELRNRLTQLGVNTNT